MQLQLIGTCHKTLLIEMLKLLLDVGQAAGVGKRSLPEGIRSMDGLGAFISHWQLVP
jgi:hypothetical protein